MAGIEKTINAEGFFGKIQQALRDGLGREMSGGANLGTVTLEVKDSRMERAEAGIGRAEEMNKNFGMRPGGGMVGNWDRPEDYPGKDPASMAASRWASLQQGGAIHTMRNVGSFYQQWGGSLGGQDKEQASMWAAMTASPGGRKVEDAFSGIERGGKKMAELLGEYESAGRGTPAALRATEQMIKLQQAIEGLADAGKEGADSIGGAHGKSMRSEIENISNLALAGKLPGGAVPAGGGGLTATMGDFMRLAHGDVTGAATSIFGSGVLKSLNAALTAKDLAGASAALGGGASGAAAIGAASLAALYGGFKFGWGIQSSSAEAGMRDAGKALDDYRLSNSLGAGFDLRGLTYTNDRLMVDQSKLAYMRNLNMPMARRMLGGMGLGAGGFQGGGDGMLLSADSIYRKALDFGVDDGALSGFVGASIRSGETGRSEGGVDGLLRRIGGLISEGNKNGVASSEKLGVLVSIRQAEQARMGFVTEGSSRYMENVSRVLDAAGPSSLKGQGGAGFMQKLAGNENPVFNSMLALSFIDPNGQLTPEAWTQLVAAYEGDSDRAKRVLSENGPQWVAQQLASSGGNRMAFTKRMLNGPLAGANGYVRSAFLMEGRMSLNDAGGLDAITQGRDPASMEAARGGDKAPDAARKEASDYEAIAALSLMTGEVLETTRSLKAMKEFIDANLVLEQVKKGVQREAWNATDGTGSTQTRGGRVQGGYNGEGPKPAGSMYFK